MFNIDSKEVKLNKEKFLADIKDIIAKGIKIHDLGQMSSNIDDRFDNKKLEIKDKYGVDNPASPKQLQEYLRSLHRAEVISACTDKGKFTTDAEALRRLSILGYEFGDDMIEFRDIASIKKAIKQLSDNIDENNMIKPEVNLGKTNRVQYSKPALLSLPKSMLWDLIAPREAGQSIWSVDIKNQEPNIIANIKNCEEIKCRLGGNLYEEMFEWCYGPKAKMTLVVFNCNDISIIKNEDVAKITNNDELYAPYRVNEQFRYYGNSVKAAYPLCVSCPIGTKITKEMLPSKVKIYVDQVGYKGVDVDWHIENGGTQKLGVYTLYGDIKGLELNLDPSVRKEFKTSWNALTYGQTKEGLKAMCKNIDGNVLWDKFNSIEGLRNWRIDCNRKAKQGKGVVVTSYFGEKMYPDGYNTRAIARQVMDYEIQGTGADILELLVEHFNEEKKKGLSAVLNNIEIYYTRHDELILLANAGLSNEEVEETLKDMFRHQIDDWKPFEVEIKRVV